MTQTVAAPPAPAQALPETPYVGLTPFTEQDAPFFFGREKERRVIAANLMASRLTLLYGASGVGKSSILRAGVMRDLKDRARRDRERGRLPEWIPVLFNAWRDDPIPGIASAVAAAVSDLLGDDAPAAPPADGRLDELLAAWMRALDEQAAAAEAAQSREPGELPRPELLVILDQFEQYFLYYGDEERGAFALEFPRAVSREDLRVNFLIALREDAYTQLDRFEGRILNLFENNLRIEHLDRTAARAAIEKPIEAYDAMLGPEATPFEIEPELVEAVIDAVKAGNIVLGTVGEGMIDAPGSEQTRVETPFLQLVMTRLWEEERRRGSHVLRKQTLDGLGGAEQIVRTHLEEAIAALDPAERAIAARVFRQLVTPSGVKISHRASDLAGYAGVPESTMLPILDKLDSQRILRSVDPAPGETSPRFEIRHDVLAAAILEWSRQYEEEQERAELETKQREQLEEERRRSRARLVFRGGIAISGLFLISLAFGLLALFLYLDSLSQARDSKSQAYAAQALRLIQSQGDPTETLATAERAFDTARTTQAEEALRAALDGPHLQASFERQGGLGPIRGAAFSPDGRLVAAAGDDQKVLIWSLGRPQAPRAVLSAGSSRLRAVAFSSDGRAVAAPTSDGTALVWKLRQPDKRPIVLNVSPGKAVESAAFTPRGDRLVTGGDDGIVRVWNLEGSAAPLRLGSVRGGQLLSVAVSRDGHRIAAASNNGRAYLWSLAHPAARPLVLEPPRSSSLKSVVFGPAGHRLLAAGDNGIAIWPLPRPGKHPRVLLAGTNVADAQFSRDGRLIVATSEKAVIVLDAATGAPVGQFSAPLQVNAVAFSPDETRLVTGAGDRKVGLVTLWSAGTTRTPVPSVLQASPLASSAPAAAAEAGFSRDGRLVTAGPGASARIWNTAGQPVAVIRTRSPVLGAVFSPDGKSVVTSDHDGRLHLWSAGGRSIGSFTGLAGAGLPALSRDGRYVLAVGSGLEAAVWKASGGKPVRVLQHPTIVTSATFSPDGQRVATVDQRQTVRIWRVAGGHGEQLRLPNNRLAVNPVAFSPDGRLLAIPTDDGTVVWDIGTHSSFNLPGTFISQDAFSPDGKLLAAGDSDGTATIWEIATRRVAALLRLPAGLGVASVVFSPDGRFVLTTDADGQGQVWEAHSGLLLAGLRGAVTAPGTANSGSITAAVVSPDDRTIVTAGSGETRLYRCTICEGIDDLRRLDRAPG